MALVYDCIYCTIRKTFVSESIRDVSSQDTSVLNSLIRFAPLSIALYIVVFVASIALYIVVFVVSIALYIVIKYILSYFLPDFLNSLYRIILYPLLSYAVFRGIHYNLDIDPWSESFHNFLEPGSEYLALFIGHVLTGFFGYILSWTACLMALHTIGFALPLICSVPITALIGLYVLFVSDYPRSNLLWTDTPYTVALSVWCAICLGQVGQVLGLASILCTRNNWSISREREIFLSPHYESLFLEQNLSLIREVGKFNSSMLAPQALGDSEVSRAIFICSTMYQENVQEMRLILKSIKSMSEWYAQQECGDTPAINLVESHIFFDGAVNGGKLTHYSLQLLSLVSECLGVDMRNCIRKETHYGQCVSWDVGPREMKFTVHFKDNLKVKNKKRWSQVMYMNYIIHHRIPDSHKTSNPLDMDNSFILMTDSDVDFTATSALVLLNSLVSNRDVGAVCARTHPKASGALYWYQVFDYAIEHWLIKPAEHLFGSVLCCPGCFSMFRCRALEGVLKEYSSEVETAGDFLTKDMGEDRWLCTLLIQKGWRLDYQKTTPTVQSPLTSFTGRGVVG